MSNDPSLADGRATDRGSVKSRSKREAAQAILTARDVRFPRPTPAVVARFPAANDVTARNILTVQFVGLFAQSFSRDVALDAEMRLPGFRDAFNDYHAALWRWVLRFNPPEVTALLDNPKLLVTRIDPGDKICRTPLRSHFVLRNSYLLGRALYLAGLRVGQGFQPSHVQYVTSLGPIAAEIGDLHLLNQVRQRRHGSTPKAGHEVNRRLKYCLLETWIAGGVWHLNSRQEQIAALRTFLPGLPPISPDAVRKAQTRLGLRWPVAGK